MWRDYIIGRVKRAQLEEVEWNELGVILGSCCEAEEILTKTSTNLRDVDKACDCVLGSVYRCTPNTWHNETDCIMHCVNAKKK